MHPSRPLLGIVLMVVALTFNTAKDTAFKLLDGHYQPFHLLWLQMLFVCLLLVPVIVRQHGWAVLLPRPFWLQVGRGVAGVIGVGLFYWSLIFIPLADAAAMVFTAPLVVTALAPLLLGEPLGRRRVIAVIIGFIGVLAIVRPDLGGERIGYLIGLGAGTTLGFFYMANRKLAGVTPNLVAVAYSAIVGAIVLIPFAPFIWTGLRPADSPEIIAFLVFSAAGQILMISAFAYGAANVIAPFQYSQIIVATLFGLIFFATFPDALTWAGIVLVAGAGIYIAVREGRQGDRLPTPPDAAKIG